MKNLLVFLMLMFSLPLNAREEFKLNITENREIIYSQEDWVYLSDEGSYLFYVNNYGFTMTDEGLYKVHSLVSFKEPRDLTPLVKSVKQIYSFGIMSCKNKLFYLFNSFFVDKNNNIVFAQDYPPSEYIVEVSTPNTARNLSYKKVCENK
jgi:hypothetical protein